MERDSTRVNDEWTGVDWSGKRPETVIRREKHTRRTDTDLGKGRRKTVCLGHIRRTMVQGTSSSRNLAKAAAAKAAAETAARALSALGQGRNGNGNHHHRRKTFQGTDAQMVSFVALRQTKNVAQMTARLTPEERERQDVAELVLKRALQYLESTYHPPGLTNNGAAPAALSKELFVKRASVGEVVTLREWFERVDLKGTIRLVGQSINASSSTPSIPRELAFFFSSPMARNVESHARTYGTTLCAVLCLSAVAFTLTCPRNNNNNDDNNRLRGQDAQTDQSARCCAAHPAGPL